MTLSPMEVRLNNGTTTIQLYISEGGYDPVPSVDPDIRITESMEIQIRGASLTAIRTTTQQIEQFLIQAANREENRTGELIYLEARYNASEGWYRSLIFAGALKQHPDSVEGRLTSGNIPATLAYTRQGYWEAVTEVNLPISNGNGTNVTTGLRIFNDGSGAGSSPNVRHNYLQIAAASIIGSAPAPIRLEMTNLYSGERVYNIYLSHATHFTASQALFDHWLQAESAVSGGSNTSDANFSGGAYRTFSPLSFNTQQIMTRFVLDATFLDRAAGRFFKIIGSANATVTDNIYIQCKLTYPSTTPLTMISESPEVLLKTNSRLQDLGTLQLPSWLTEASGSSPIGLTIYARNMSGTGGIAFDWFQFTPLESYRELNPKGYGAAETVRIVDDGMIPDLYTDGWAGGGRTGHYTSVGEPIQIRPGKSCRIYFLQTGFTGDVALTRLLSVIAYYRPRRLSL